MSDLANFVTVGQAEFVSFPKQAIFNVPARIDTGARTSSVWASDIRLENEELKFKLFAPESEYYTGEEITTSEYTEAVVASSNGVPEVRFKVVISLKIAGKRIKTKFTLADRSSQAYPVLIGRNTLRGKFIVNVKAGTVLRRQEKARTAALRKLLELRERKK